jgi:predicted metal-dependent phosphoesterase TrpH
MLKVIPRRLGDDPSTSSGSSERRRVVIDLHLHTTASDGRCTPWELVDRVVEAGITVMAVTDHDTTGAVADVQAYAHERGISAIAGIEITANEEGRDIHILGYFIDPGHAPFVEVLQRQRTIRRERVEAIGARLAELGMPIDVPALIEATAQQSGKSLGRPQIARAMIQAGHVTSVREAFDHWLATDRPAFIPRSGPAPEDVIAIVHAAGGLVSLAHPGRTGIDPRIIPLHAAGLDAIEVYHSDHDEATVRRYYWMACDLGLLMTGGSDYHGDPSHGVTPGTASLPQAQWQRLHAERHRHAAS